MHYDIPKDARTVIGKQFVRFFDEQEGTTGLYQQVGLVWTDENGNTIGKWDWELMS